MAKAVKEVSEETLAYSLAAEDLAIYASLVHRTDDGKAALPPPHILNTVIPAIEDDSLGHTLIIAPPGSAKTNTMIAACGWWLGRDPNLHVAYFCDNATRGIERSMAVRAIIEESPEYKTIFPDTRPNPKRGWAQDSWYLERKNIGDKNPSFLSGGMDSSVLGARIDRVVMDDVWNEKIASSEQEREKALRILTKVMLTRLHPQRGRMIGICTRWGEDDFAQWAMDAGFHTIHIPAIDDEGESYWPSYFPREKLRCRNDEHTQGQCCIYRVMGSAGFTQQYMGDIASNEDAIFASNWWESFDEEPESWDKGVIVCDTAGWDPGTTTGDFTAMSVWLKVGWDYYVTEVVEERLSFPDTCKIAANLRQSWGLPVVVEDVPWARPMIQALQKEISGVVPWKVQGKSKENRARAVAAIVEAGRVYLPRNAKWRDHWISQHRNFPNVKHDDLVDNTSMALGYLDRNAGRVKAVSERLPFSRQWNRLSA